MGKIIGIIALILGIIAISPLNFYITVGIVLLTDYGPMLYWLIPIISILFGIIALVMAKGDSKSKKYGILGIVFGAIDIPMFFIWTVILPLLGLYGGI